MARFSLISGGILVTGAGGFVGSAFAMERFRGQKVRRAAGDLTSESYCHKILRGVHTVFYLAGSKKNLRYHTTEPFTYIDGNVRPFASFLSAAAESKVKKIIYLSSTIVEYAALPGVFDGYVVGKNMNEHIFSAFSKQFPKVQTKVIRAAPVYGPGDNFQRESANFIPATILKVEVAKREIEVWGTGKRRLQFIYIDDLVRNLVAAEKNKGNYFVVGSPESASVNEIVRKIIRFAGKELEIRNNAKGSDKSTKLTKFNNLVEPKINLEQGIEQTIKYFHA